MHTIHCSGDQKDLKRSDTLAILLVTNDSYYGNMELEGCLCIAPIIFLNSKFQMNAEDEARSKGSIPLRGTLVIPGPKV